MIEDLDHIGIAVHSVDEAVPKYTDGLGMTLDSIEEVPTEKVRVAVLLAGRTRVELLEPTAPDSPIAKFLEKRGPGVHHLAFRSKDLKEQIRVLLESDAPMLGDAPRPGAHGTQVAFLHPKFLGGVLTELVQHPD